MFYPFRLTVKKVWEAKLKCRLWLQAEKLKAKPMVPAAAATVKSKGGLQSTGKVAESALAAGYRSVNIKDVEQKWELSIWAACVIFYLIYLQFAFSNFPQTFLPSFLTTNGTNILLIFLKTKDYGGSNEMHSIFILFEQATQFKVLKGKKFLHILYLKLKICLLNHILKLL